MRWLDPASAGFRLIGRPYGVFFFSLGVLFLYWSARGLFAYQAGDRAAWADPAAAAAGLIAGGLSFWAGVNMFRRGILPGRTPRGSDSTELDATLEEAMKLEQTDHAGATQFLDSYFMRQEENTTRRREELLRAALYDLRAATALRKELWDERASHAEVRKEIENTAPESQRIALHRELDAADRELDSQLSKLDATIGQHTRR